MITSDDFIRDYLPLSESLYRVAFYALESQADAEDAVQDLYIKLWSTRDTLEAVRNPKAYCITLMKNMCIDMIRKASGRKTEEIQDDTVSDESADTLLNCKERRAKVMQAIEALSDRQKKVLQMRAFEDLSYEEIAEKTGMSNLSLRVTISSARQKIKKVL